MDPQTVSSLSIVTAHTLGKLTPLEIGVLLGIRLATHGRVNLDELRRMAGYADHTGPLRCLQSVQHVLPDLRAEATHAAEGPRKEWVLYDARLD